MSKNQNRRNSPKKKPQKEGVILLDKFSKEELKQIIVEAYFEIEGEKKKREEEQRESKHSEWQKAIGYKEYTGKFKIIKNGFNCFYVLFKFILLPRKQIVKHLQANNFTTLLFQLFLSTTFSFVQWLLVAVAGGIIILSFYSPFGDKIDLLYAISCSFVALLFSVFFRFASVEVGQTRDRDYLLSASAAVAAIAAIIVSVVGIVLGVIL